MPRLGILGGGQLAKMTAVAASNLGCEVYVLEKENEFPARSVDTHSFLGDWNSPKDLLEFANHVDTITLENEFVDLKGLRELEKMGHRLFPSVKTMERVQDKWIQKQTFLNAAIPVAKSHLLSNQGSVRDAAKILGWPLVLKKRHYSYDGKGNALVENEKDISEAWEKLNGDQNPLYAEMFCPFVRELAMIVTRSFSKETCVYPVVETLNHRHICNQVFAPARISPEVIEKTTRIGKKAVEVIEGVGSFGIEFFQMPDGEILINEIAPRVHNTGHYTIEACECSQFENHVRAILGWPLGSPAMRRPHSVMVNLLAEKEGKGYPNGLDEALRVQGVNIHIYGKLQSRKGRKMGHVTALGQTHEEAFEKAQDAAAKITFGGL